MHRKYLSLFIISTLVISLLCGCSTAASNNLVSEPSKNIDGISIDNTEVPLTTEKAELEDESANVENSVTSDNSELQNTNSTEQGVLYKADFEIPDCRGLGYTNLVDFYNDYPNGKNGGTFSNAGIMVHYRNDMDKDMSVEESLAFRTYRDIGLGSTLDEVFNAYGTVNIQSPYNEVLGISDSEHTLKCFVDYVGEIDSGALVSIRFYFDQNDTVMFIDYNAVYAQYASNVKSNADINKVVID